VNLENLHLIKGGLVAAMLQKALDRMAVDITAAPDLAEFRQVILKIRAKPVLENMELDHVQVEFDVAGKTPSRSTSANCEIRRDATDPRQLHLCFALDSEEDPRQTTIHDVIGDPGADPNRPDVKVQEED
jgi:hypothetical protein